MTAAETTSQQTPLPTFTSCKSFQVLKLLAQKPYDLTVEGNLSTKRIASYIAEGCGFKLLYATQRVDENTLGALANLAEERNAVRKMKAMQEGAVVNLIHGYPSEDRPALHTALRDFFDSPIQTKAAIAASGQARCQVEKLRDWIAEIDRKERFTDLVVIGIGGSELGPKACCQALSYLKRPDRHLHYIGNVDPDCAAAVLERIDPYKTLVAVVSKSGTTQETAANEALLRSAWLKAGCDPAGHFIAVTAEGSPMDDPKRYCAVFQLWDWVGGRYSSSSMVGGLPMAFLLGFDAFWELLQGAHAMDKTAREPSIVTNLPLLAALLGIWNHNFLECPTVAVIPYADVLGDFGAHIQQLDMESNGKRIDQNGEVLSFQSGPIIWGRPGTNAQHSFFQLIHQGTATIPLEFIGFAESQYDQDMLFEGTTQQQKLLANLLAQAISLATGKENANPNQVFPGNRPSSILIAQRLTPFQMGALLAFYEHKVAFQGFIWGINSFDQEGVQLGKRIANTLLETMQKQPGNSYPIGEAFLKLFSL